MSCTEVKYSNFLQFIQSTTVVLALTSKLEKTEVKEVLEQQNPVDSLAMLMELDS
ncbi:hypothetical protein [Candidatus Tisiphia endosymbiont of Oplodontha viridula]|uniref:hypothetical protein n=1 Tax=Candidatus Tisiphia endosymbiont of Oplodontha viridula TaxID=3077925 RepID=UPI0035C8D5CE